MFVTNDRDHRLLALANQANRLQGCLSGLRTAASRRQPPSEHADSGELFEPPDPFICDRAKILSSKAYRVMQDKTQVFTLPRTRLTRTRMTHVMEVVAIATMLSDMLGLNTSLVEAAALGHDIGHVPFGHQGEAWLAKAMGRPFCHEHMGVITAQFIERRGRGLNLTYQTLEGMLCHSGNTAREGMSQEAWVLRYADKMAYLFADYNDIVVRAGYPVSAELRSLVDSFGANQRQRTSTAMAGLIVESAEKGRVSFEGSELGQSFQNLRRLMYQVYGAVTQQDVSRIMDRVLEATARLNIGDPFLLVALMTDSDVIKLDRKQMIDLAAFNETAVSEIFPYLADIGPVDMCDHGLHW